MKTKTFTVHYRRKREGKTDYKTRIHLLLSKKPRLVIRKSLKNITLQIIEYAPIGDRVLVSVNSGELIKLGWKGNLNSLPASYLCGFLMGKKAVKKKIGDCILDIGFQTSVKGCALYSALKGAVDAGLKVAHSKEIFPNEKRTSGEHVAAYAKLLKSDKAKFDRQFAACNKKGLDAEKMVSHFNEIKAKIGA